MRIAASQFDIVWEDPRASYARVEAFARSGVDQGIDLLVLPEMFATGFSMDPAITAEPKDGDTASFLRALAGDHQIGVLGGVVFQGAGKKGRNSALLVDRQGRDLAVYAKTHLFSFMDEHHHHEPGKEPELFELNGAKGTCFICYDLRFPELFRLTAESCDVVFVIASWPSPRQQHWDILLPARAVENQQYVVGVNRIGHGGGLDFTGGSAIYDPQGNQLAHANDREELLIADIDPQTVKDVRRKMPFLKDRRF